MIEETVREKVQDVVIKHQKTQLIILSIGLFLVAIIGFVGIYYIDKTYSIAHKEVIVEFNKYKDSTEKYISDLKLENEILKINYNLNKGDE